MGSLNINGGRDRHKLALVSEVMLNKKLHVILLQETHSDIENEIEWGMWWKGQHILKPGSHCAILPTICSSETNFENPKILKDSCNPRLKSVVFDRWFDMSTDSRLMAVAINFFLRLNSGSVRRFQTLSCSVTSPTTTVKPRTNRCAEPDDAISATTSNHENVETSQVDSTTGRKTY